VAVGVVISLTAYPWWQEALQSKHDTIS